MGNQGRANIIEFRMAAQSLRTGRLGLDDVAPRENWAMAVNGFYDNVWVTFFTRLVMPPMLALLGGLGVFALNSVVSEQSKLEQLIVTLQTQANQNHEAISTIRQEMIGITASRNFELQNIHKQMDDYEQRLRALERRDGNGPNR